MDNPKSERIGIRVTPEEKQEIFDFCKEFNTSILALIQAGMEALKRK